MNEMITNKTGWDRNKHKRALNKINCEINTKLHII